MALIPPEYDPCNPDDVVDYFVEAPFREVLANNVWRYDPENRVVSRDHYEVPLDQMPDSNAILAWLDHVGSKTWATSEVIGDLVLILNAVLGFRANYCGIGIRNGCAVDDLRPIPKDTPGYD